MADSIKKLQEIFSRFPTVGSRTASRFVFYLLKLPRETLDEIVLAISELKSKVKFCNFCFNPYEPARIATPARQPDGSLGGGQNVAGGGQDSLCQICQNASRDKSLLCLVEKEADLLSIENSKQYNGLFFILGGPSGLRNVNTQILHIKELTDRIKEPEKFGIKANFKEIIIAVNPTPEGKLASLLVQRSLKELIPGQSFKVTHLGRGLPVGGELEYADEETLASAFEGRK